MLTENSEIGVYYLKNEYMAELSKADEARFGKYWIKGDEACKKGEWNEALTYYTKALEIEGHAGIYNNIGSVYYALKDYTQAIKAYRQAIVLDEKYAAPWNGLGNVYADLKKYPQAIKAYRQAIELDEKNAFPWNGLGNVYADLKDYTQAIESYQQAIELDKKSQIPIFNKALALLEIAKKEPTDTQYTEIGINFMRSKFSVLKILSIDDVKALDNKYKTLLFREILLSEEEGEGDAIYKEATEGADDADKDAYIAIYLKSLELMSLLRVQFADNEKVVAHYTRRFVAESLLFKNKKEEKNITVSPLRLNTAANANDPKEGRVILDYLGLKEYCINENVQAFIACFIFNPDSLNQFRLYGKEDNREATGLSLVFDNELFNSDVYSSVGLALSDTNAPRKDTRESLFRCAYLDPTSGRIISVGQKEDYQFYREGADKQVEAYQQKMKELVKSLNKDLAKLSKMIKVHLEKFKKNKEKLAQEERIITELLINLRYLIKHISFKEEQEARIIRVKKLTNEKINVDYKHGAMYTEYIPIATLVREVYFAPKATGFGLFKDMVKNQGLEIRCYKNEHPFN